MKIALTTKGSTWDAAMDPRFGRTEYLLLYDDQQDELTVIDNRHTANEAHGAGTRTAQKLYDLHPDILITGNGPGDNAAAILQRSGIRIYAGAGEMTAKQALEAFRGKTLTEISY
jgi:predicted Fe-Mo cluster-binding NifX family protein